MCCAVAVLALSISPGSTADEPSSPNAAGGELKDQPAVPARDADVSNGRGKIVGGTDAPAGRYPWIVALAFKTGQNALEVKCGGTLIRSDWVISAAHCKLAPGFYAIADRVNLASGGGQVLMIKEVWPHPKYDKIGKKESDVVLARLERSTGITPINVVPATQEDPEALDPMWVAGWGKLAEDDPAKPDHLQHVQVRVADPEDCTANYGEIHKVVSDRMFCAAEQNADACGGDSGGPLVAINLYSQSAVLTGVVSWGEGCARPAYPGVYVKVSRFRTWIDACIADSTRAACR
jgi:secreted trypsin-like serine protease